MTRTPLLFLRHFHQPDYRDPWSGLPTLPWVRLHACRGYSDILTALEQGESKWTINWTGTLLEQLESWNPDSGADVQYLLAAKPSRELTLEERIQLLSFSFWANHRTLIQPLPKYRQLLAKRDGWITETDRIRAAKSFTNQELRDLQVLFNLSWCGFTLRKQPLIASLLAKGANFTEDEKQQLLQTQADTVAGLIPRYRDALRSGKIEISTSPYTHPIIPLLIDSDIALEAMPDAPLPKPAYRHPEYAQLQLKRARKLHQRVWHNDVQGLWPPEGSVSPAALECAAKQNFQWAITDEGILARSLRHEVTAVERNRIYRLETVNGPLKLFFRNRALSDAIGFRYNSWEPGTALEDLFAQLTEEQNKVDYNSAITIALDGENAWEAYDDGAEGFLTGLSRAFVRRNDFRTTTPTKLCNEMEATRLDWIASGSWINANFRIWCGDTEKNRAWNQLERATKLLQTNRDSSKYEVAESHLLSAQASDWFWWYGDIFQSENDPEFDRLFRGHLARVHELTGDTIPQDLLEPAHGNRTPNATFPAANLDITIDGKETAFYEWLGAGEIEVVSRGAIRRSDYPVTRVRFGYDTQRLLIALDGSFIRNLHRFDIVVLYQVNGNETREYRWHNGVKPTADVKAAANSLLEIAVDKAHWNAGPGNPIQIRIEIREKANVIQRIPEFGVVSFPWHEYE
ncbi:MAG: glycoside hydrolase family 57 protein, partial [bacterium]|nr:glycoside hydrolase family 57 protein [bacterium]